jgi:replicative DNA helicase
MKSIQNDLELILSRPVSQGVTTGIKVLDQAIKGLQPGHTIIIAGCSSMGKSSLMRSMILSAAKEVSIGVFAIEGGVYTNVEVMLYSLANLNYHKKGSLDKFDEQDLKEAKKQLKNLKPIYFDGVANTMYPGWILEREQKENSIEQSIDRMYENGARLFFIDYLQLINWGAKYESETLRIKDLTGKLTNIAITKSVPMVLLAQLNKAVADRAIQKDMDPTPTLNDIRDSGYITNDADEILLLHRPEYFRKKGEIDLLSNCSEEAQIIVAKNRFGPTGAVPVKFQPYRMYWCDIDEPDKGGLF